MLILGTIPVYGEVWLADMALLTLMKTEDSCCNCGVTTLCASRTLNTFFQHKAVHKYTWCRYSLGQWWLTDFCIVSAYLFHSVLEICVRRGAELPTDIWNKVARRPWAPRTVLEFTMKTRYVREYFPASLNSWIVFTFFIYELLITMNVQESNINNVNEQNNV